MPEELPDQAKLMYELLGKNKKVLLIVLDACNWRVLCSIRPHWKVRVVRSRGSCTNEWFERSFNKPLRDVVYISANPCIYLLKDIRKRFNRIIDLYLAHWDEKVQTVRPRIVNFFVKENIISGATKIVAHFMQPHAPFLTNTWLHLKENLKDYRFVGKKIYDLARISFDARAEFRQAYFRNLEIAALYVELLIKYVEKLNMGFKIVVTSDHSEVLKGLYDPLSAFGHKRRIWLWVPWLLGIYRFVGHESESRFNQLYEVPWVTFQNVRGCNACMHMITEVT